jgi:hypothetical protein
LIQIGSARPFGIPILKERLRRIHDPTAVLAFRKVSLCSCTTHVVESEDWFERRGSYQLRVNELLGHDVVSFHCLAQPIAAGFVHCASA